MVSGVQPGLVLDERFEILGFVASGGMGSVYRAQDHRVGSMVALKVLDKAKHFFSDRFAHETVVLSELRHPGIVAYVGQGLTPDGRPYLAMEWVEGSTLRQILRARRLTTPETIRVTKGVAEALGEAHRRGIIHRDLKPANLMLTDEGSFQMKILDFGLATLGDDTNVVSSRLEGTPGYMSPEHALAEELTPRSDIFSLGCVLYECLTQSPAFVGQDVSALLAKVAVGRPEPLRRLRSRVPVRLRQLIEAMLEKSPSARPDVDDILGELDRMETDSPWSSDVSPGPQITYDEQQITCVVVAQPSGRIDAPDLEDLGFTTERLADGTVVAVLGRTEGPLDSAIRGIRAGRRLSAHAGSGRVTVGLDHTQITRRLPSGNALERAFARLGATPSGALSVDESTATLAADRIDLVHRHNIWLVEGERSAAEEPRPVLGKITPLIGRSDESELLRQLLSESVGRSTARVVLVSGESGVGKSRLLWTFAAEAAQGRNLLLRGRGELDRLEPNGLWLRILQDHLDATPATPPEVLETKLEGIGFSDQTESRDRMLGWLSGGGYAVPSGGANAVPFADFVRRRLIGWLENELASRPVVIVVDDLHYVDLPSQDTLRRVVERFADRSLLVIAGGPRDAADRLSDILDIAGGARLDLGPLASEAASRLVVDVLGSSCDQPTRDRILDQAQGNPFVLEELMRAVARGEDDDLPQTVLGLLQARLQKLSPSARRILRAASIFGKRFSRDGARQVAGATDAEVDQALEELVKEEVVRELEHPDVPEDQTYRFRHSLIRDTAYSSFPTVERQGAHARAAEWLGRTGLAQPRAMARHWEKAGLAHKAGPLYRLAAERAFEAHDLDSALELSRRGLGREPSREDRAALALVQAEVRSLRGQLEDAARLALDASSLAPPGSRTRYAALALSVSVSGRLGESEPIARAVREVRAELHPDPAEAVMVLSESVTAWLRVGRPGEARTSLRDVDRFVAQCGADLEPTTRGYAASAHAASSMAGGAVFDALEHWAEAANAFRDVGNMRRSCVCLGEAARARIRIGDVIGAQDTLDQAMDEALRVGLPHTEALLACLLGNALGRQGHFQAAQENLRRAIRCFRALRDRRGEAVARVYMAANFRGAGAPEEADEQIHKAIRLAREFPTVLAPALAVSARVDLQLGRVNEAVAKAEEAKTILGRLGHIEEGETTVLLIYALCMHEMGRFPLARSAIIQARDQILAEAQRLRDPGLRSSFLVRVPENARVLSLARRWNRAEEDDPTITPS